jgi:hypothetical protein
MCQQCYYEQNVYSKTAINAYYSRPCNIVFAMPSDCARPLPLLVLKNIHSHRCHWKVTFAATTTRSIITFFILTQMKEKFIAQKGRALPQLHIYDWSLLICTTLLKDVPGKNELYSFCQWLNKGLKCSSCELVSGRVEVLRFWHRLWQGGLVWSFSIHKESVRYLTTWADSNHHRSYTDISTWADLLLQCQVRFSWHPTLF